MLDWASKQHEHPVVIHLPERGFENRATQVTDFSKAKYEILKSGSKVAILGLGSMYSHAENVADELEKSGITATLVNPLFINKIDKEALKELVENHQVFVTIEDGSLDGGFGQKVAAELGKYGVKVLNFGAITEFIDDVPMDELYTRYHLTPELMSADIVEALKNSEDKESFFKKMFK